MNPGPDTLVIGGGIAGLSVALALADRGRRVVVADEVRRGAASRASAGMLAPGIGFGDDVVERALTARDFYPGFLERLTEATGVPVWLNRRGIIELASDDTACAAMHARARQHAYEGPRRAPACLTAAELESLEPGLGIHPGGLLHHDDGAVDVVRLMDALDAAVDRRPAIQRLRAGARSIQVGARHAEMVTDDGVRVIAAGVVIAAGAWAGQLAGLPRRVPVRPVRGQLATFAHAGLRHVVDGAGGYLVPRGDTVLVGATVEEAGFAAETTDAGRRMLADIGARALPSLANAPLRDHWAGLRPVSDDMLPIAGIDANEPRLAYCCGLSRNGVLFGPWIAEQVAREMCGEAAPALDGFRMQRFGA